MAELLFKTNDVYECHKKLEEILGYERDGERLKKVGNPKKEHKSAECRVDVNDAEGMYQIWSGPLETKNE